MGRFLLAGVALVLPLAACGGDDDALADESAGGSPPTQAPTDDADGDDAASGDTAGDGGDTDGDGGDTASPPADEPAADSDGGGESGGTGPSTATVTIDGTTYEYSTEGAMVAQCLSDLFGVFSVQLPGLDGEGGISIVALREGTDPAVVDESNSVEISVGDEDWVADEASELFGMSDALEAGMSQVDSVEIDGSTVRGSATFVRQNSVFTGEIEMVTGTFEATCGEERVS